MSCGNKYLTARMCMGCDRRRPVWGESVDEEEWSSGEMWLSACECWPCRGWLCCMCWWWLWWWWCCCKVDGCPLWSSGVDSVCWPLQVEYRLSREEFMSFTRASKSTSSSGRDRHKGIIHWLKIKRNLKEKKRKIPSKEGYKTSFCTSEKRCSEHNTNP